MTLLATPLCLNKGIVFVSVSLCSMFGSEAEAGLCSKTFSSIAQKNVIIIVFSPNAYRYRLMVVYHKLDGRASNINPTEHKIVEVRLHDFIKNN